MCFKKCFTKQEGENVLARILKSRNQYRNEKRMYYCPKHNAWHLTSKLIHEPLEEVVSELADAWKKLLEPK